MFLLLWLRDVSGESQELVASNKSEAQAKDCLPHVRFVKYVRRHVFLIKTCSHLDNEVVFAMPLTLQLESHHTSAVVTCMRLIVLQNQK